jgi:predicted anti-sigma-YlaC factor YlaD
MPFFPLIVFAACLVVYVGFPALATALLFRGGLLLRLLGLAVVRRDGERASRLRVLWRGVIAWSPFFAVPFLAAALNPLVGAGWAAAVVIAFLTACVGYSLSLPGRSLQDRLAGTCLVNR